MRVIKKRYLIKAPIDKVWDALTNVNTIEKWGAGPAAMNSEVGFSFSLWGGDIYGKNLEIKEVENGGKKLVQEWFGGEWEIPSIVSIELNPDDDITEVLLEHKDLPKDEIDNFESGWDEYYFGAIKKVLE